MPAAPIIPIRIPLSRDEQPVAATISFANHQDVAALARWRVPALSSRSLRCRAADAREFARFSVKRWQHYRDTRTAAQSLHQLQQMIARSPQGEFCFHLKLEAPWFPATLGCAMIRRTWHHHLALDFLFVHPRVAARLENIKFAGRQLLQAVCLVAHTIGCPRVWGEATEDSAPFYRRYLQQSVDDQFIIPADEIAAFAASIQSESRRLDDPEIAF
jgi:hypothetical protein